MREFTNRDIFAVWYETADGALHNATVESHCRIAALNDVVVSEARASRQVIGGYAELLCPGRALLGR
jgi:hypothetical protein